MRAVARKEFFQRLGPHIGNIPTDNLKKRRSAVIVRVPGRLLTLPRVSLGQTSSDRV